MVRHPIRYALRIERFCKVHGIDVPVGFSTRSAYKFALIDTTVEPNKLVAVTDYPLPG